MSQLQFSQIFDGVQRDSRAVLQLDALASYSLPVPRLHGGRLCEAVFAYYHVSPKKKPLCGARPFAWMLFAPDTGWLLLAADCAAQDFACTQRYPIGGEVDMHTPDALPPKRAATLHRRIMEIYERLRVIALGGVTPEDSALMAEYRDLFMKLTPVGHLPFYHALSPEFFQWLELDLPHEDVPDEPQTDQQLTDAIATAEQYQLELEQIWARMQQADSSAPSTAAQDSAPNASNIAIQVEGLLGERLNQLLTATQTLDALFRDKIQADAHKNALFDRLHDELAQYKNDLLGTLINPIVRDVIRLIDDTRKTAAYFEDQGGDNGGNFERLLGIYRGVETDLQDILYRHGVEPYSVPDGMDLTRQRIVTTTATDDPALDKRIAKRVASGWEKDGKIIRPEMIAAYVYVEGKA